MEIYHISAECYPVAKVGGLADVVGALPKYLNQLGHFAKVVVPGYDNKFNNENEFDSIHEGKLKLGSFLFPYTILKEKSSQKYWKIMSLNNRKRFVPKIRNKPPVCFSRSNRSVPLC